MKSLAVLLVLLFAWNPAGVTAKEASPDAAWRRDWKTLPFSDVLELGGMNTPKKELKRLPFWLGQTGIVARMDRDELTYVVTDVAPDSPSTDLIKKGDVLLGVNNRPFARTPGYPEFVGPNPQFGSALLESWARLDGRLSLKIRRGESEQTVELTLPGRGAQPDLTEAWINTGAEFLASRQLPSGAWDKGIRGKRRGPSHYTTAFSTLALMATGDSKWRPTVKRAVKWLQKQPEPKSFDTWHYTYLAVVLGEHYMLTGDRSVRGRLQECADVLSRGQFHYFGSGHASHTGNYRGSGITICTTHALLGMAYARLGGAKVPDAVVEQTLAHIERISPNGDVPYTVWRDTDKLIRTAATDEPNKKNEHAARSGTALLAFRLLGGSATHQRRISDFLSRNSDYMDNGHATGNTLGWTWGSLGLAVGDESAFAAHMQRRA